MTSLVEETKFLSTSLEDSRSKKKLVTTSNMNFKGEPISIVPGNSENKPIEMYGYNVISDQDPDILEQGEILHIKNYFDQKEKELEKRNKPIGYSYNNIIITPNTQYSINNVSFFIKLIIFLILLVIICDFLMSK
jgi:hypothetical protein